MMPKLAAMASAQNRSFGKSSKEPSYNEVLVNRSFSGFVNRAFVKESLSRTTTTSSIQKDAIPVVLPHVPTQSSTTSSERDDKSVASEPSSFWNEWADDMLQHDTSSRSAIVVLKHSHTQPESTNMSAPLILETSTYDDPSFAIPEDESVDLSTVTTVQELLLLQPEDSALGPLDLSKTQQSTSLHLLINDSVTTGPIESTMREGNDEECPGVVNTPKKGSEDLSCHETAVKEAHVTPSKDQDKNMTNDLERSYDQNESIDTLALMNLSQVTEGMAGLIKKKIDKRHDRDGCITRESPPIEQDEEASDEEDQSLFYPMHTSINTYAAMNISQATVNMTTLNKTMMNETEVSFSYQAMEFSSAAAELLRTKSFVEALELFHKAANCYAQQKDTIILAAVNEAGCYRNMSAVARMLERYEDGASYLRKAEELYVTGREAVDVKSSQAILTLDGKHIDEVESSSPNHNMSVVSCYTSDEESMCLDAMILETIQSRAMFHVTFQDDPEQAVECYEQSLKHLIHLHTLQRWEDDPEESPVREQGVTFLQLSKEKHTALLALSLESLGSLYRTLARGTNHASCLTVYEDALDILQTRQEKEEPSDDGLIYSVSQILRYLSEIYFGRKELDRAVDALHDSTAVKLTASGEPCREALEVMDKMGAANEKMQNWEKALSCYEQTLFARCKYYGNTHFNVAKSLVNVARVMERKDGSSRESIELYKAANAIFALQMTSEGPDLGDDVEAILQLIPSVIRQGRFEKAVEDLNMCLAMANDKKNAGLILDKAQIYFDLGRAYMGMGSHKMATESLMCAIKEVGDVNDEAVFTLLQRVEFLEHNDRCQAVTADKDPSVILLDPTLSFHDITFQLQGEPSVYIFEDETINGASEGGPGHDVEPEGDQQQSNPHYDILYQSFSQDRKRSEVRFPIGNAIRTRLRSPKSGQDGTTTSSEHSQLYTKISATVAKIVQRLIDAKTPSISLKSKYKLTAEKLKRIRAKCFKLCQGVPSVATTETRNSPVEALVFCSFACPPNDLELVDPSDPGLVVTPRSVQYIVHQIKIEEVAEGFESTWVNSSTSTPK